MVVEEDIVDILEEDIEDIAGIVEVDIVDSAVEVGEDIPDMHDTVADIADKVVVEGIAGKDCLALKNQRLFVLEAAGPSGPWPAMAGPVLALGRPLAGPWLAFGSLG